MTKKQELLLKEIEELRENYFQRVGERNKEERRIYEEKKVEIERWKKLREEERKDIVFPVKRIIELEKEMKEESKKFDKAIKEKMLEDLSGWALDPQGFFYRVDGRLKNIAGVKGGNYDRINFRNHPNSNYRDEIVNKFIEEIKQNPQDWKIRRAEPIIHGIPFNYGTHRAVEHKSGRKHYKPDFKQIASFSDKEWAEIENVLNNQKEPSEKENKLTDNQQNPLQKSDNKENNNQNIYYGVGLISVIVLLASMLVFWIKKKK